MANRVRNVGLVTLLTAALSFSFIAPTSADSDRSKPKPSAKLEFKDLKDKFHSEKEAYKAAMKARKEAREKINEDFKNAIKKATSDAKAALAVATTAEQKLIIMNLLKNARTSAVAVRDSALLALGSLPTPPSEPKKDDKRRTLAP